MALAELQVGVTEIIRSVGDKFKSSMSFLNDMKEPSFEKISNLANEILGLAPLIEVTGFSMKNISVDVGIPNRND